jgi:2-oxo-4-hydroxy-4-carboxy-5-ureidoimidazoline decarboxylase
MPTPLSIEELSAMDREAFVRSIGDVFEHSPWIAAATWSRRPFRDAHHLHAELCATLRNAPQEQQLALIRAHPDLAGRLARERRLGAASSREQAAAGLEQLDPDEEQRFQRLNAAYRERFGFPFVICARLNARDAILAAMEQRAGNAPADEFKTALAEIEKIAELRLRDRVGSP